MGGRGSSSGGGSGMGGGGGQDVKILESTDLITQRERKKDEVDKVLTVLKDIDDQYGYNVDTNVAKLGGADGSHVMAFYEVGSDAVSVNKRFFDTQKIEDAYARSVAAGFHPSSGTKSGLEATIAHEMAHGLTDVAAKNMGEKNYDKAAYKIVGEAFGAKNAKEAQSIAGRISGYATHSDAECIAEAFADVYCNGSNAKAESQSVVNVLNKYLRK